MLYVSIIFGALGIGLFLLGRWGARSNAKLSTVPGYDQRSIEHRATVLRRGHYTCYLLGAVFVLIALVAMVIFPTDPISCAGLAKNACPPLCALEHRCPPVKSAQ